jgi:phosphatidate cytidylyltransferase
LLLLGLFLGSLFWHPLAFTSVVAAFVAVAAIEASQVLAAAGVPVAVAALVVGGVAIVFGAYVAGGDGQAFGVLILFLATVVQLLANRHRRDTARMLAFTLLLGLWTGFLGSFGVLLVTREQEGAVAVLAVAGAAILADVGAYATGVTLGRHKLAPVISPNKTWEGLIGGVVVAAVVAAVVLPWAGETFDVGLAVVVAALAAVAGAVGDLSESMFKRDLGVKDLGRFIPGHGGILDRVDGILVAFPVGWYALVLLT